MPKKHADVYLSSSGSDAGYKIFLLGVFVVALILSSINPPAGGADWLLENSPLFAAIIAYVLSVHYLKISNKSYTFIVIYLMFP